MMGYFMETSDYLEKILGILSGSFDIYRPVTINSKEYPAYAYYFSLSEKFLVTQKVNLWSARVYEHILFMQAEKCSEETLADARALIETYMEETYVRKGEKYPEKDHMVSYVTVCILSESSPAAKIKEAVSRYRFNRNYLFTFRGIAEGRIICVDLEAETVHGNRSARQVFNIYSRGFHAKSS